jgi:hypothetical protein
VKGKGQGLPAGGHNKAFSRALVGEKEVLEVKGKIRNKFFPIYICHLIKNTYDL